MPGRPPAFQVAARAAFREAYLKAGPAILEPIMTVDVEVPTDAQGPVVGDLVNRRGVVLDTNVKGEVTIVTAEVPLANLFGYATDLRSATKGRGTFSMEFGGYKQAPRDVQEEVIAKARESERALRR